MNSRHLIRSGAPVLALALCASACDRDRTSIESRPSKTTFTGGNAPQITTTSATDEAMLCRTEKAKTSEYLARFDELDFELFSNQKWDDFKKSHAPDIVVHWPDGHTTKGLDRHIEDLKAMFTYAPDTRIKEHPIKFGSGEFTSVIGLMEGTFTKPMLLPGGKTVAPTKKAFKLPMSTIGRWQNGLMVDEYLFWDNAHYMKQLGVPPQ